MAAAKAPSASTHTKTIGTAASAVGLIYHHGTPARYVQWRAGRQTTTKGVVDPANGLTV